MSFCDKLPLLIAFGCSLMSSGCLISALGGSFCGEPSELRDNASAETMSLIDAAYADIDADRLVDYHTHVVGLGMGGTGNWINPAMRSWTSPIRRIRFSVYFDATGIENEENADAEYVARLVDLIRHQPKRGKFRIMAFDHHYNQDGSINEEKSEFYVPNEYVFKLAAEYPDLFIPTMSVHPYRPDALTQLETWAAKGGQLIKWLPNAMGMDPSDERIDAYYQKMIQLGLVLISHSGEEKAVEAEEDQKLGNPLLLRRPLDAGVHVIVAHCASLGENSDLDSPERELRPNFELFMRLMDDPRYEGRLFAEVSAMLQANRIGTPLTTMLQRSDLHPRLVNGSDYPLPAINVVIRTGALEDAGYITSPEREMLNEIYEYNPMLFDFVLKRTVRAPGTDQQFSASVFHEKPEIFVYAAAPGPEGIPP